jgi:hypothetical protein
MDIESLEGARLPAQCRWVACGPELALLAMHASA